MPNSTNLQLFMFLKQVYLHGSHAVVAIKDKIAKFISLSNCKKTIIHCHPCVTTMKKSSAWVELVKSQAMSIPPLNRKGKGTENVSL